MNIKEITIEKALSQTSINLADRVINPYRGCAFGCLYCYAARTKNMKKLAAPWGSFVDIKTNLPALLEKELLLDQNIKTILLGSTTDPYQPIEEKYELSKQILEIIKHHKKEVVILTRSPLIERDIELLKQINHKIFFTFTPLEIYNWFEPNSPTPEKRLKTIELMRSFNLNIGISKTFGLGL